MISAQKALSIYRNISAQSPRPTAHKLDKYDTDWNQHEDSSSPKFKDLLKKELAKKESKNS